MPETKRILIFSLKYYPFIGGAEIAIKAITDRLPDISFDMITLRLDRHLPRREKIGNITVHRIGLTSAFVPRRFSDTFPFSVRKFIFPVTACLKALRLQKENHFDAVWTIIAGYASLGALFFNILRPATPYILTLQEGEPIENIKRKAVVIKPLFKMIFRRAAIIQTISNYLAAFARDSGYRGLIEVIPNGVNSAWFGKNYPDFEIAQIKRQIKKGRTNILGKGVFNDIFIITTSRLVKKNAVADIVLSLGFLPEYVKLLVIGDGPLLKPLKKLSRRKGLETRVSFLGFVEHNELPKYLKVADIFVRPSLSEGFGNSFIEAMAAGLPVIATPVGGILDFLFDPEKNPEVEPTGLFCRVSDPRDLAEKIRRLVSDDRLRTKIAAHGRKRAYELYDWNTITAQMRERVFNPILKL